MRDASEHIKKVEGVRDAVPLSVVVNMLEKAELNTSYLLYPCMFWINA